MLDAKELNSIKNKLNAIEYVYVKEPLSKVFNRNKTHLYEVVDKVDKSYVKDKFSPPRSKGKRVHFSETDCHNLVRIVQRYRHIVESRPYSTFWTEREVAWEKITKEFNISTTQAKTTEQLRSKFQTIVRGLRCVETNSKRNGSKLMQKKMKQSNFRPTTMTLRSDNFDCGNESVIITPKLETQSISNEIEIEEVSSNPSSIEIDHQNNEIKPKNNKCPLCYFSSFTKITLQRHIKAVHLGNLKCDICSYSSFSISDLEKHVRNNHKHKGSSRYQKFPCKSNPQGQAVHLGSKNNTFNSDLHTLVASVLFNKRRNYNCHLCDYSSFRNHCLKSHVDTVHLKIKRFKCNLCEFRTSYKTSLNKHYDAVHLKVRNYKCDSCDFTAQHRSQVQYHIDKVHLKMKKYKCNLCDYGAYSRCSLRLHMYSRHLNIKNKKCEMCNYSATYTQRLNEHINSVHLNQKRYKCDMCDYKSVRNETLKNHIAKIHLKKT